MRLNLRQKFTHSAIQPNDADDDDGDGDGADINDDDDNVPYYGGDHNISEDNDANGECDKSNNHH